MYALKRKPTHKVNNMQNINTLNGAAYYDQLMKEVDLEPKAGEIKTISVGGNYGNESGYNNMVSSCSNTFSVVGVAASALVN